MDKSKVPWREDMQVRWVGVTKDQDRTTAKLLANQGVGDSTSNLKELQAATFKLINRYILEIGKMNLESITDKHTRGPLLRYRQELIDINGDFFEADMEQNLKEAAAEEVNEVELKHIIDEAIKEDEKIKGDIQSEREGSQPQHLITEGGGKRRRKTKRKKSMRKKKSTKKRITKSSKRKSSKRKSKRRR